VGISYRRPTKPVIDLLPSSGMLGRAPGNIKLLDIYRANGAPPAFGIHSYGVKPCLSELLSQAQDNFETRSQRQPLLIWSARLGKTSVAFFFGPLIAQIT
jgi:hypothetical protein